MTNNRVVLVAAIVAALLTYGGLVGGEALLTSGFAESTADEAVVEGTTIHLDRSGRPTAVGEVRNRFDGPITNVTVTVQFFHDDELVDEQTGRTLQETIPAGEPAPFDIHMNGEQEVDEIVTSVSFDRGGDRTTGLELTGKRVVREGQDQVDVAGTVTNVGDEPLVLAQVVGTFYDDKESVIGARTTRPDRRLEPGESITVRISFRTLGDVPSYAREFNSFRLSVVAENPE